MTTATTAVRRRGVVGSAVLLLTGVLVWTGGAAGAALPGLPGKLACVRELRPSGNLEIQTMNPDGSAKTNLTNNAAQDFNPIWSPDGRIIVFESERLAPGTSELWTMAADGSNPQPLIVNGATVDRAFAFHPDGSQIVIQSNRDGNTEIYKMNVDATSPVNLSNDPAADANADWSPDGTKIVWDSARTGNREIWVMDPFGNNKTQLTFFPGEDSGPRWSPDGSKIAFQRNNGGNFDIMVMNADGSNVQNLTNHPSRDTFAAWSPDGTRIAFTSYRDEPLPFGEVYVMNATDGSNVQRITFEAGFDGRCDWQRICTVTGAGDITGTAGDDVICGSPGNDRIAGLGGHDIIYGFAGDDQLSGGDGNDTLFGGLGNDSLVAGAGAGFTSAGPGNDRIVAESGERIDVGAGADQCSIGGPVVCPPRLS